MKKIGYAAVGVIAVVVIFFGLQSYLESKYRNAVATLAQSLQPNYTLAYGNMTISPFSGKVDLYQVTLKRENVTIASAEEINLHKIDTSGDQLSSAAASIKSMKFSPTGGDVASGSSSAILVTGNSDFEYSHDPKTNSYDVKNFLFSSAEQKMSVQWADAKLDKMVFGADNKPQSFSFSVEDAVANTHSADITAKSSDGNQKPTRFSTSFSFERSADAGTLGIKNFNLKLPESNEFASFDALNLLGVGKESVPMNFAAEIKNLNVPIASEMLGGGLSADYGYTRIKADARFAYDYAADTKLIKTTLAFNLPEMFKLGLNMDLSGVDLQQFASDPKASVSYDSLKISSGELNFSDLSFFKKSMELAAKAQNLPLNEYTTKLAANIDAELTPDPKTADPATVDAAGKLKNYLNTMGSLTMTMKPQEPVALSQFVLGLIIDRSKLLKIMGVTVTVS